MRLLLLQCMSPELADSVAKVDGRRLAHNNRIMTKEFLNQCCALVAVLESMLPAQAPKIVLQHYRHDSDVWKRLPFGRFRGAKRTSASDLPNHHGL